MAMKGKNNAVNETLSINSIFKRALTDKSYESELSKSYELEGYFEKLNSDIEEEVFLSVINKSKFHKNMRNILFDAKYYIITERNVTDKVFYALLDLAKKRNCSEIYVALCHAKLKREHIDYLKSLNLDPSYFY